MRILYWSERRPDERLVKALGELHHAIELCRDFDDAQALVRLGGWDAILCELDRADPERIARLREAGPRTWLIVIGGPGLEGGRIALLRAGADAVFIRPYEFRELSARLDALARRSVQVRPAAEGELRLDLVPAEQAVLLNGEKARLSPREYAFMALLAARPGEVLTVQEILEAVWGQDGEPRPERVHAYASRLRAKLERGRPWQVLEAVRGHGYRLRVQPTAESGPGRAAAK